MTALDDARTVMRLLRGQHHIGSHAERLNDFYAPQANHYDHFRERLLHGREALVSLMNPPPGARVVELGCGTGQVLDFFGERTRLLGSIDLVDLCDPLLDKARVRAERYPGVARVVRADIETYQPDQPADCVYFAYSLTMVADWRRAIDNALRMLRPGGVLGVVDFYVANADAPGARARHGWVTRNFWPKWFAHDGVRIDGRHLDALERGTTRVRLDECLAPVPWLPWVRVPYYIYVGRRWHA